MIKKSFWLTDEQKTWVEKESKTRTRKEKKKITESHVIREAVDLCRGKTIWKP